MFALSGVGCRFARRLTSREFGPPGRVLLAVENATLPRQAGGSFACGDIEFHVKAKPGQNGDFVSVWDFGFFERFLDVLILPLSAIERRRSGVYHGRSNLRETAYDGEPF